MCCFCIDLFVSKIWPPLEGSWAWVIRCGSYPPFCHRHCVVIVFYGAMNEFRIHHDVNELLSLLHVRGGDGAEGYIDLLQKHRTPYVTTTVSAHSAKASHSLVFCSWSFFPFLFDCSFFFVLHLALIFWRLSFVFCFLSMKVFVFFVIYLWPFFGMWGAWNNQK